MKKDAIFKGFVDAGALARAVDFFLLGSIQPLGTKSAGEGARIREILALNKRWQSMLSRCLLGLAMVFAWASAAFASEPLDKIVASVDRHPIMRSEVEEEARFAHFISGQPGKITVSDEVTALNRLIDRALIDDQIEVFGTIPVESKEVQARIADIRRAMSGAATDESWRGLLAKHQLDQEIVAQHVEDEIRTLRFIDMRFRSEVRVGPRSIQTYYDSTFVPQMRKQNLTPPPLPVVQPKIEAILREQRVDNLISEWLKSLRTQSRIQTFDPNLPLNLDRRASDLSDLRFLPLRITAESQPAKQ